MKLFTSKNATASNDGGGNSYYRLNLSAKLVPPDKMRLWKQWADHWQTFFEEQYYQDTRSKQWSSLDSALRTGDLTANSLSAILLDKEQKNED